MNRKFLLGIMLLAVVLGWLVYVFGFILSPMAELIVVPTEELDGLHRVSKIMLWSAAVCLIAAIVAAGGAIEKSYIAGATTIAIGLLIVAILSSVISASMYFFRPL